MALISLAAMAHLDLCSCTLQDDGISELAGCLTALSALTALRVGGNGLCEQSAAALAGALATLKRLEHFDIQRLVYGAASAAMLGDALIALTRLSCLEAAQDILWGAGTELLERCLPAWKGLAHLDASCSNISSDDVTLGNAMAELTKLSHLELAGIRFNIAHARWLDRILPSLTCLAHLVWRWCAAASTA